MVWAKTQPCVARHLGRCSGEVEADHSGWRGLSQKADDATCVPLCTGHHRDRTDFSGAFKHWDRAMMRQFLEHHSAVTRAEYERRTGWQERVMF